MPAEAVCIEPSPQDADAEWAGAEEEGEDAAAHGGAGGVLVCEGAEADACVAHSGGCVREGKEEQLIEDCEQGEDSARGDDGGLEIELADGELADGNGEDRSEGQTATAAAMRRRLSVAAWGGISALSWAARASCA
jgi:hypothetical protein